MPPFFLEVEHVVRIHLSVIERYGGQQGIRDMGLLHSAVAMPQAAFEGCLLHEDVFAMAGAYLFHIVQDHPFIDGNKRTGAAAAIVFMAMNDVEVEADEEGLVELTMAVARGEAGIPRIADFFRSKSCN
jgi:death-on-curing protein